MAWETVIGLEVHVQLGTRTKAFCACPNRFGDPPNTNVCPVCLGLPGALPVPNDAAVDLALRVAFALDCGVPDSSVFARKNYFYPDLPKGYQISQYERPLARGGVVPIEVDGEEREVPLVRIHLEEDAGKSFHDETGASADSRLDLNRCGAPLIEIVSAPAMRHPAEAAAFLESLRRIVQYLGVSDADMSRGEMRCDANVSVREEGGALGTKTEVKNLNSIRMVEKAIGAEAARQVTRLEAGRAIGAATLLWDEKRGEVREMRSKEEPEDYRYFPEPDLPPLVIDAARRARARGALPELPFARRDRLIAELGLSPYAAGVITGSRALADGYEALAAACGDATLAANWTLGEVLRIQNETGAPAGGFPVDVAALAGLLRMVKEGRVSDSTARKVLGEMIDTGKSAAAVVEERGWAQLSDESEIAALVDEVLAGHAEQVEQVRAGNERVVSFLVGQVMKASGGRANPKVARDVLDRRIRRA